MKVSFRQAVLLPLLLVASSLGCAGPTGEDVAEDDSALSATQFRNPVIRMFERPPGVSGSVPAGAPGQPTEGCPDPSGLKTRSGEYYLYCTSYTFPYSRYDGLPFFKSASLGGPWERAGALIPDGGPSRSTWPHWIKDARGGRDGSFWAPDVHQLPNGKFLAGYSAPCGTSRCVGFAWADRPDGPWKHSESPYISSSNNGVGSAGAYDQNLLITTHGDLYLYWVVAGHGVYGVKVETEASGEPKPFRSSDVKRIADRTRGQLGEGPYVVEHAGAFYEFYSTGSLEFSYHVGVRRGPSPLAPFNEEGPKPVIARNEHFVATGGNSLIHDAVNGTDYLVYHAIVVPADGGCPRRDPESAQPVQETADNPHCRVQGERQAMVDPLEWKAGPDGIEWPVLKNGTGSPSVGKTNLQ